MQSITSVLLLLFITIIKLSETYDCNKLPTHLIRLTDWKSDI